MSILLASEKRAVNKQTHSVKHVKWRYLILTFLLFFIPGSVVASTVSELNSKLLSIYHLEENATPYVDSKGLLNLTAGTATSKTGGDCMNGDCLYFTPNNYLISENSSVQNRDHFGISFWFNLENELGTAQAPVSLYEYGDVTGIATTIQRANHPTNPRELRSRVSTNIEVLDDYTGLLVNNTEGYAHIFLCWNGTELRTYKNGVQGTTLNGSGNITWSDTGQYTMFGASKQGGTIQQYADGYLDEVYFFDDCLSDESVQYLYNSGNGTFAVDDEFPGGNTAPSVAVSSPANDTRTNEQLDVEFTVTDDNATELLCELYVDDVLNASNASVSNNTLSYLNSTLTHGFHVFFVNCSDGELSGKSGTYNYDLDISQPQIESKSPSVFNTTIFSGYTMNIKGNVTDNSIFRVNRTIYYPNATVYYNNYSGNLTVNTTLYEWDDTFNTSLLPNGAYTMFIDSADSHTGKYFPPAQFVNRNHNSKQLEYGFDDDTITVTLIGGNILGQFNGIDTEKLEDRYTFDIEFKNDVNPNSNMIFRVQSENEIIVLSGSPYPAHMIISDKYWIDFAGIDDAVYDVTQIDSHTVDVEITTPNGAGKDIKFKSLGGLNENNVTITFDIDNCIADWVCSGYASCNISDKAPCNNVTDNNACGLPYSGDYSEFTAQDCDYCARDIEYVSISDDTCDAYDYRNYTWIDNNYAVCCNVTGDDSDCLCQDPNATTSLDIVTNFRFAVCDVSGYESYINEEVWFFGSDCGYEAQYSSDDIAPATIDVLLIMLITLGIFVPLIVIVGIGVKGWKKIKGK